MKPKVLTNAQARELKFFCENVVGTRNEFYEIWNQFVSYKDKLDRLNKTCVLIEKYLGEQIEAHTSAFSDELFSAGGDV